MTSSYIDLQCASCDTYLDLQWWGFVVHGHSLSLCIRLCLWGGGCCWVLEEEKKGTAQSMLALIKQNNTNKMSSFSHSSQFCLFIDNPSWVTAAVFANLVAGQGLNFDPSCFLVIQFQSTCAIHPLCTWNWTKSRGHNQLSTDREQPTESSPGKHRLENQLPFFSHPACLQ